MRWATKKWCACLVVSWGSTAVAADIGTAFTYQGHLENGGGPVTDTCDFEFGLYSDADGTMQIGATQPVNSIVVSDGVFTVGPPDIDFGPGAIDGTARWLKISVCCPSPGCTLEPLLPLVELTPAPHALALPGFRTQQNTTAPNVIGGFPGNSIGDGVIGATVSGGGRTDDGNGGFDNNRITDDFATIGGGRGNAASGANNTIGGGFQNITSGSFSTVGGGILNVASGGPSTVCGGEINEAGALDATVGGGFRNTASGHASTVGGGSFNLASGAYSTVSGGRDNEPSGFSSTVGGGAFNDADGDYSTVPGGLQNASNGDYSFAAGQQAKVRDAVAVGEDPDTCPFGTCGDEGTFVWADSTSADFVSTGPNQFLIRTSGGVRLATGNGTTPQFQAILPSTDTATNLAINPLGGHVGIGTTAPVSRLHLQGDSFWIGGTDSGGLGATAGAGLRMHNQTGVSYIFAYDYAAGQPQNLGLQVNGGNVGIGTTSPSHPLHVGTNSTNGNGAHVTASGVWTNGSDRNSKQNFESVDAQEILQTVAGLPVTRWRYKGEPADVRHIGPVAQDFRAAFGLGHDERYITTIDADGVALAAIQGLHHLIREKDCEIGDLNSQVNKFQSEISHLRSEIDVLKTLVMNTSASNNGDKR